MFRRESPQAWMVVRPLASNGSKMSGTSCSRIQCNWIDCRVVQSKQASPTAGFSTGPVAYTLAFPPASRSRSGVERPVGVRMRSMTYDPWPSRRWYSPTA